MTRKHSEDRNTVKRQLFELTSTRLYPDNRELGKSDNHNIVGFLSHVLNISVRMLYNWRCTILKVRHF